MNHIHSYRVLIVGAGIAGLTSAALLRRHGWQVDLVERAPALRTGGYKVDVRGAGTTVLDHLGVLPAARERATHVRAGTVVGPDGATLAAMGGDTFGGRGGDDLEIERGDLIRLLADAAGPITFGTWPTAITQGNAGAEVTFNTGAVERFDVVLGADGLHSSVRRLAVAPSAEPVSLDHAIAVVTLPSAFGLEAEETTCVDAGRTACCTRPRPSRGRGRSSCSGTTAHCPRRARRRRRSYASGTRASAGGFLRSWLSSSAPTISTSTTSHRCSWTSGRPGAWG